MEWRRVRCGEQQSEHTGRKGMNGYGREMLFGFFALKLLGRRIQFSHQNNLKLLIILYIYCTIPQRQYTVLYVQCYCEKRNLHNDASVNLCYKAYLSNSNPQKMWNQKYTLEQLTLVYVLGWSPIDFFYFFFDSVRAMSGAVEDSECSS